MQAVQGRCRRGAGELHHLHLGKHNIRFREVQAVQAHLKNNNTAENPQRSLLFYAKVRFVEERKV